MGKVSAMHSSHENSGIADQNGYMKIRNQNLGLPYDEGKNLKLTLEDLERMTYQDISENKPDEFKPSLILREENNHQKKGK